MAAMRTLGHLITAFVPWIAGITFTGLVIYWISRIVRYRNSDAWTLTSGRVENYDKPTHMNAHAGSCFTQVRYSYSVENTEYSGTWLTPTLRNLEALNAFLEKELPLGKTVSVRYKPGKPGRSVMLDGPEVEPEAVVMKTDFNA